MLTLHHLEYSQSFRILWLLEAIGTPYELVTYPRDGKNLLAPPAYKDLSPLGTAPVITDGDLVLAETNAIIDHLLDQHPNDELRPPIDSPHRSRYLFWFHTGQGSLTPLMMIETFFTFIRARVPFFLKPLVILVLNRAVEGFLRPRLELILNKAEQDLAHAPWFGGETLSAADIVMSYAMEASRVRGHLTDRYPNCHAWLERVREESAFQAAKAKVGNAEMVVAVN